jgi:hypothetical protein
MARALTLSVPAASGCEGVGVRVPSKIVGKCLDDSNHSRSNILVLYRSDHKLFYGLVGCSAKLSEKLAMIEEIGPQHFWYGENPLSVANVLEEFVF